MNPRGELEWTERRVEAAACVAVRLKIKLEMGLCEKTREEYS